jgi:hypothetical protein
MEAYCLQAILVTDAKKGFHGAAIFEGCEDFREALDFAVFEEPVGKGVDTSLFRLLLGNRTVEAVEKAGETNHMDELVSDNIDREGEELDVWVALDCLSDYMILDADLEVIDVLASPQPLMRAARVAADLSECVVGNFFFPQILQGLDVVAVALPLRSGNLVEIADMLLGDLYRMPQYNNFFCTKGCSFHFVTLLSE